MMTHKPILALGLLAAAAIPAQAALTWTGAGDGASLYQEANWRDDNGDVPADDTINGGTPVTAATGNLIEITSGTGTPSNYGGNFLIGSGNDLRVGGGKILASPSGSGLRVSSAANGPNQSVSIVGASTIYVQYLVDLDVAVAEGSTLRLRGGGTPVNGGSTIDLQDTTSLLLFDDETWTAFDTEHKSKTTYLGAALVFGSDPFVIESGDNALATAYNGIAGVQIQAVPEPSSALLGALGLLGLFRRRRN